MSLANLSLDSNRALTFRIGDTRFGIDVTNILAFSDEYSEIRSPTRKVDAFAGYLDYRERLVKVFECATALNRGRERESLVQLIDEIDQYRLCHRDWLDALELSIRQHQSFNEASGARTSEFGRWYYNFDTPDDGLNQLLEKLDEPHQGIHELADRVLSLVEQQDHETALQVLSFERPARLRKVERLFALIKDYLRTSIHPVVLHLTQDGLNPWFALVLDEIDDIVEYDPDWIDQCSGDALGNEPIAGYIRHKSGQNFMMLAVDQLYTELSATVDDIH